MDKYIMITTTFDNKEEVILDNHSYETPQLIAYDINGDLPPENLKNCEIREYEIMEK